MDTGAILSSQEYDQKQGLEVMLAQMENRLRTAITELVQPTVQRTAIVVADVDNMKGVVSQHTRGLQEVQLGQFKAFEQVSTIASFKEEMGRWDAQRRVHEASLDEKLTLMTQELAHYRYSLEQKESALHHLHRSVDRTATEVNRLLDEQEVHKETFENRLDAQSKSINTSRAEIDVRIAGLDLKHNALTDQLWGEETGLAKVCGEVKKTNAALVKLEAAVDQVQESKAEAAQLDRLRTEVQKMVHEANTSVMTMRQNVGNVVNEVREHFRTASQTISAHNSTFISEVRQQYQEELAGASKLRHEVQEFMGITAKSIDVLDGRVAEGARKAEALAAEVRDEVEELNRKRKSDKTSSDNELKALKKRLGGVFDNSDSILRDIDHIYAVIQMVLDSEFMQCSVELQDSSDRKRIALVGVRDDDTALSRSTATEPQRPRPECRAKTAGGAVRTGSTRQKPMDQPIVRVDNRCLGCSGQAPLVLSAFKMACLQYSPTPVEHDGKQMDRGELIGQRHRLLHRARMGLLDRTGGNGVNAGASGGLGGDSPSPVSALAQSLNRRHSVADGDACNEAFSEYAAVEARVCGGTRAVSAPSSAQSQRLPKLGTAAAAMAMPQVVSAR